MVKLIQYVHKTIITTLCLALIVIMMINVAHFINRQQTELSDSLQSIAHQLIRQSAYSLGPLINSYNTANDNSQQINAVLQHLAQQPWIIDIAVYQLNGSLIAQAGENISVRERLALNDNDLISKNTVQIVEKIDLLENPVGFIRLTLDPAVLQLNKDSADYTIKMIWFILLLAASTGFVLALTLKKWRFPAKRAKISNDKAASAEITVEQEKSVDESDGNIK